MLPQNKKKSSSEKTVKIIEFNSSLIVRGLSWPVFKTWMRICVFHDEKTLF